MPHKLMTFFDAATSWLHPQLIRHNDDCAAALDLSLHAKFLMAIDSSLILCDLPRSIERLQFAQS